MQRWKLTLEFDGTPFVGWQRQAHGISVQEVLEQAICKFAGESAKTVTAGRTDAGVHARGLVVHTDISRPTDAQTVCNALNFYLKPHPVSVLLAEEVAPDFHARFWCKGRAYLYRISNRPAPMAIDRGRTWHVRRKLDATSMNEAAQFLLGNHDFTSFRAGGCQAKSPIRTLDKLSVTQEMDEIHIRAEARSFLHHQVRNIVGTLKLVGEGSWQPKKVREILEACDRKAAGPTAPPQGLYFLRAWY